MSRSFKSFLLSAIITLILFSFVFGIFMVTKEGRAAEGKQENAIVIDYDRIMMISEISDNAITFLSPETKAAAHLMLWVCAALSKLY